MKLSILFMFACFSLSLCSYGIGQDDSENTSSALDFTMKSIDGKEVDLSQYKGKVVLVVNVASECGLTPQYQQLQSLFEEHQDDGLVVLGFPCNQFGGQEPGTDAEVKQFCTEKYEVTFPMFSKIDVNGEDRAPLFQHLTTQELPPAGSGDIKWNFEKFLIDREGKAVARFGPRTKPDEKEVIATIKKALEE